MVDPIKSLPFETIVQIFSLLSTPELALSTATSRDWRQLIRTDPIINKVIDLTGLSLNEDQTIWLIRHLCKISTDPGKRVGKNLRINLDSFWRRFIHFGNESIESFNFESLLEGTDRKYAELIHTISSSTQGQLGKLFIHVSKYLSLGDRDHVLAEMLTFTAGELGKSNNLLDEVRFIVPFPISVEALRKGENGETEKLLSIENACEEDEDVDDYTKRFDSYLCRCLLEQVVEFVGAEGGLSWLDLDMSRFTPLPLRFHSKSQDDRLLFLEIAKSRQTLERLELRFDSIESLSNLFDLVVSLSSLTLLEFSLSSEEGTIWLNPPAPKQAPVFQLESLKIWAWEADTEKLDWLVDWVGPDLEEFTLYLSSNPLHSKFSEATLCSILKTSSPSLTELILGHLSLYNCSDTPLVQDFPNLEYLSIEYLSLRGYEIFAGCSIPGLQRLAYGHSILGDQSGFLTKAEASAASKHFATILKRCRSTLESLELVKDLEADLLEETEEGTLELPELNEVEFNESNFIAIEFLSHFQLPLLRYLKIYSSSTQPHSLSKLLRSASSHLQEVTLSYSNVDLSMVNIFSSKEKVLLPNLSSLEIDQSDAGLIDLFSNAVTGKLEKIKIVSAHLCEESDLVQPRLPKSVINLLTSNAPSLVILQLEVFRCSECDLELSFPNLGAGVEFTHLRELRLGLNSPQLLQYFLSDCNLPSLSILWLNTGKLPLYRITNFIKDRSSFLTSIEVRAQSFARDLVNWTSETERQVLFPKLATLIIRLCSCEEIDVVCQSLLSLTQVTLMMDDVLIQKILEAAPKAREVNFYAAQREQREDDGNDQI